MLSSTKVLLIFINILLSSTFVMKASYSNSITGEVLFNKNCAACHKKSAPNLSGTNLKLKVFRSVVINGRAGTMMGAFQSKLNDEEVSKIYYFLINQ